MVKFQKDDTEKARRCSMPINEIWRDEETGFPMHWHAEYIPLTTPDGHLVFEFADTPHRPCNCGDRRFDLLLSSVQSKAAKEDCIE
jgi:hypothetical protein